MQMPTTTQGRHAQHEGRLCEFWPSAALSMPNAPLAARVVRVRRLNTAWSATHARALPDAHRHLPVRRSCTISGPCSGMYPAPGAKRDPLDPIASVTRGTWRAKRAVESNKTAVDLTAPRSGRAAPPVRAAKGRKRKHGETKFEESSLPLHGGACCTEAVRGTAPARLQQRFATQRPPGPPGPGPTRFRRRPGPKGRPTASWGVRTSAGPNSRVPHPQDSARSRHRLPNASATP